MPRQRLKTYLDLPYPTDLEWERAIEIVEVGSTLISSANKRYRIQQRLSPQAKGSLTKLLLSEI